MSRLWFVWVNDYEQLKRCAARYIWRKRKELTASGKSTWQQWWDKKFNDDLDEYARRNKRKDRAERGAD